MNCDEDPYNYKTCPICGHPTAGGERRKMLNPRTGKIQIAKLCFECVGPTTGDRGPLHRSEDRDPDMQGYQSNARRMLEDLP